jgi:hypothetical protein
MVFGKRIHRLADVGFLIRHGFGKTTFIGAGWWQ